MLVAEQLPEVSGTQNKGAQVEKYFQSAVKNSYFGCFRLAGSITSK